ncbi:TPA: DUF1642 domain-containing protein [Enterococcus faecium]|uniref:DUF1642 domain-containing protein n=1 Tax=Enterococcus faecium TaxID=1352 RepID=UPI001C37136A|nr:DUF1642 domain-containing protein [Enterococcus faecium]MDT0241345.1 DUF1642 domain-containing protein [Enterococcus faecium]MDT0246163.1 DUF1642 domain-containing protein [Enterococcus faecium]MDT0280252.1 DUF1642 domain-containing protein [Enterococcus faecium]MDT0284424.1 DUF1642 domain-containing protein [Enterococcus faecium]MDT0292876.1 DUF1642 domain-containing protein [Enterococcus faecium]
MNKQELIDKLSSLVGSIEDFKGISTFHAGKYAGLEHALELIQQLNESQKPVIPQLVAGWIEKSTDNLTKAEKIAYLIKSKDGDSYYFCDWFVRDGILTQEQGEELLAWATRQSYETLLSLYNGYEVEKEPLYEVIIGDLYLIKKFNNRNDFCFDTSRSLCTWEKSAYQLTEAEIKEIDERYWPFAVPVEEVAER